MDTEAPLEVANRASRPTGNPVSKHSPSPLRRRRRVVLIVAAGAALVSAGGVAGATLVRSPAQVAADTRAPAPSVITSPVVHEVLRRTVVLRGTFSDGRTVSAAPSSVADVSGGAADARLVVTGVFVHTGESVRAGRPLVEYSGRPVFALAGSIPAYRDLVPTDTGKDVAQLQHALQSLGYGTGADPIGTFADGTKRAVTRLYSTMGYAVPQTSQETQAAVQTAQHTVDQLRAQSSTSSASKSVTSLRSQLTQAEKDLTAAQARAGAMVPSSEIVFVPTLPARVVSVPVTVGDPVKGPIVTLALGGMELNGTMDPTDQGLVKAGMAATVFSETTGDQATGVVTGVGSLTTPKPGTTDTGAADGAYIPLRIRPDHPWPAGFEGQDVRITITAATSAGPILAVPEAAISSGADTQTTISVIEPGGKQRILPVTTGVSADGMIQVTPLNGTLTAGTRVVVGQ